MAATILRKKKASNKGKIKAIVFDLDGLLVDTETIFLRIYSQIVRKHTGRTLEPADLAKFVGTPEKGMWKFLRTEYELPISEQELSRERIVAFSRLKRIRTLPGTRKSLEYFVGKRVPLAVASSSERRHVRHALRVSGLAKFFSVATCFEDTGRRKPAPDLYLLAAKKLRISPANCIAVEDSEAGIAAAKRAGFFAVAVPSKYTKGIQDFSRADAILGSVGELIYLGRRLNTAWET